MKQPVVNTDPQRRRLKSKWRIPKWMRSRKVFRCVIFVAVQAYRLWQVWDEYVGGRGG